MDDSPTIRAVYTPSGRFARGKIAVFASGLVGIGLATATCFAYLTGINSYFVGVLSAFATAGIAVIVCWAISVSKCRNRVVGCAVGLLAGLITIVGMYHLDQCYRWGVPWERIDKLPGYITFRMETDGWIFGRKTVLAWPLPPQAEIQPWLIAPNSWNWHWTLFIIEFAVLVVFPAYVGWERAGRPFDEQLCIWMKRVRCYIAPGEESAFLAALDCSQLRGWANELKYKPAVERNDSIIAIWFVADVNEHAVSGYNLFVSFGSGPLWLIPADQAAALADQSRKLAPLKEASEEPDPSVSAPTVSATSPAREVRSNTLPAEWAPNLNTLRHRFVLGLMERLGGLEIMHMVVVIIAASMAIILSGDDPRDPERLLLLTGR